MLQHVPLHVHTEYSLLDGASRIPELVNHAKSLGLSAISITDHGVMYGCYELLKESQKAGIKPILGSEIYVINGDHTDKSKRLPLYHLVLLAKNDRGYQNLTKIVSEASLSGFYYKPRIAKEFLKDHAEGLICLTACLGGEVPNNLLSERGGEAKRAAEFYQGLFGEDFYLEIQDHGMPEESRTNHQMVKLAQDLKIKLVATNDSHFTRPDDAIAQDAILCLQTNRLVRDFPRMRFSGNEYLKSAEEMVACFPYLDARLVGRAVEDHTLEILDKITGYPLLENTAPRLPKAPVPEGETNESFLRKLSYELATTKYPEMPPQVVERLEYELKIIEDSGFAGYLLIVWDFIRFARREGIPVGPGRGSAAGSLVAYVLGITNIDPLRFNLLFERFLNPERKSMPDIDTDFCIERRGEVVEYVRKLYGEDRVAQIITFNRLTSRAVVKDVARVLNYPYQKAETLAKTIPVVRGKPRSLDWMVENHPEFKKTYHGDSVAHEVVDLARKIEGTNKSYGVHAAGVIIGDLPLTELVPLTKSKEGGVITQYSMDHMADLGLLKMDFLGLRNLTMIQRAVEIIAETTGKPAIDIDKIPLDDPKVFELLSRGDLVGVFQLETSSGMRQVARELKPGSIDDLSAIIALYRPGPLDTGMIDEFIARKHGRKKIVYQTPELEPILKDTYGTIVYQEQIMQIAQQLAGFSLGQADLLRRAMGKKKPQEMAKYQQLFLEGARQHKIDPKVANELFEMMLAFAEYCFNKSHSAAYGMISYQTAWLKANYPVQYLTALMSSVSDDQDKVRFYILEAQRMGIQIKPPDINHSSYNFTAEQGENRILFGLSAVKNVGGAAVEEIIRARREGGEFESLADLCQRVDLKTVNRRALESLIRCGAFAEISKSSRAGLIDELDSVLSQAQKQQELSNLGQVSLFGGESEVAVLADYRSDLPEYDLTQIQKLERELLGFYVSSHPLESCLEVLPFFATHSFTELPELEDGTEVSGIILLSEINKRMTKSNKLMAVGIGEDLTGKAELIFFSRVLDETNHKLSEDARLFVRGKIQIKSEGEISLLVNEVKTLEELSYCHLKITKSMADLTSSDWQALLMRLREALKTEKGDIPVILTYGDEDLMLGSGLRVSETSRLKDTLARFDWIETAFKRVQ
ncbi:MAG: DNA polymerase III subunit alpha [Candidatus Caenarcaniphilales bacterium]|nr:DNA polymerase III subunit alpha [Candidatus Caenarcaniphilales bacterium]